VHREKFPRIQELRDLVADPCSPNAFFQNFDKTIDEFPPAKRQFLDWECELQGLDVCAWNCLKEELKPLLMSKHPTRGWQTLFDKLNHAKAYNYLKSIRCANIGFVPVSREAGKKTPDLESTLENRKVLCEVKTINVSADEAKDRSSVGPICGSTSSQLSEGFFNKLKADLARANGQMDAYCEDGGARKIAFIVINFDDSLHAYANEYEQQIKSAIPTIANPDLEIILSIRPPYYTAMA
jgi:hypothetical protein